MVDTNKLRQLAQAATQGRWKVGQYLGSPRQFVVHMDVGDKGRGSDIAFASASFDNDTTIANARLIAAANPAAVSELLGRLEAAENERDALRAKIGSMERQEPIAYVSVKYFPDVLSSDISKYLPVGTPLYLAAGAQGEEK